MTDVVLVEDAEANVPAWWQAARNEMIAEFASVLDVKLDRKLMVLKTEVEAANHTAAEAKSIASKAASASSATQEAMRALLKQTLRT